SKSNIVEQDCVDTPADTDDSDIEPTEQIIVSCESNTAAASISNRESNSAAASSSNRESNSAAASSSNRVSNSAAASSSIRRKTN
ncbi:hypothetical protein JTB14_022606, partial [Gonioctena quinquepunctata]